MVLGNVISPGISLHTLLTAWQTDNLSLAALGIQVTLAVAYLVGVRRLAARGRSWSRLRTTSFLAATMTVVIAVQSGLASYDNENFSIHVIQHLLLMNMAPILYALSAPMTLALQASNRRTQQRLLKILHHPFVSFVTNPIVAASTIYVTMIGFFLTPFYNFSLEHPLIHDFSHLHFLITGCIFWWVIVGADPSRWHLSYPAKLGLLATGIPVTAVLGLALTGTRTSIAPAFHSVADTRAGGSLLWVVGELTMLTAMGLLLYQWMRFDEREAIRADRRADLEAERAAVPAPGD